MVAFSKFARGVAVFAYLAQAESNSAAIPEAVANVSDLMDEKVEAVKEAVDPIDDELDALDEEQGGDSEDAALDKVRELLKRSCPANPWRTLREKLIWKLYSLRSRKRN